MPISYTLIIGHSHCCYMLLAFYAIFSYVLRLANHFEYSVKKRKKNIIFLSCYNLFGICCLAFSKLLIGPYEVLSSNGRMLFPLAMTTQTWLYTMEQCWGSAYVTKVLQGEQKETGWLLFWATMLLNSWATKLLLVLLCRYHSWTKFLGRSIKLT